MKVKIKVIAYLLVFSVFLVYLFSANYLFNAVIKTEGEAALTDRKVPVETRNIHSKLEEIKKVKLKWKDCWVIRGWVIKDGGTIRERNVYLLLKSKKQTMIFNVERDSLTRPDIAALYATGSANQFHGFEVNIPAYWLKDNHYDVGIIVEDEAGEGFAYTGQEIRALKNAMAIGRSVNGAVSEEVHRDFARKISLTTRNPEGKINYCFDQVEGIGNFLSLRGWAFIEGSDARSLKHYVSLKRNGKENFFEVTVNRRSDVTSHYSKTGLNLDSCGFSTVISTKNLDKGNYTLGLYLEKGNHTSLVYSKGYNIRITDIAVVPSIEEPSPLVQLSLSKPTKTIKYIFDLYKETEDFVMVWGWGLLVNSATETGKAYLLLKKNEKVSAFDATLQLRPDITAGYGSGTINLDSSGYRFRVFKSNLEKGKYQVGLCIKKGKECGIIYSEKYIEIK